jgi:hypothetical protein
MKIMVGVLIYQNIGVFEILKYGHADTLIFGPTFLKKGQKRTKNG